MLNRRYARWLLAAPSALLLVPDAIAQRPGKPLLEEVAQAMGGRDRILGVHTLVLEGTGENYNLGQNTSPESALPVYAVTEFRRTIDLADKRWRHEQSREPRFLTANTAAQRQRIGYDSVAFDVLPDGTVQRVGGRADIDRANELMYSPIGFLQMALRPGSDATEESSEGGMRHLRVSIAGNTFAITINQGTRLPARIEKMVDNSTLGDVILATEFSDWREVDGLKLPMRIAQRLDGRWPVSDLRVSKASVNADVGDLSAPANVRSTPAPVPAINVTTEEIAPGVWYLAGQTHHSVVIEMRDHLLLVEAPQSDARTLAVIQKARALRPGKPLRAVINTHHHFDHAGGVRAALSQGLTVITYSANRDFFEELARRRHSIVADALSNARDRGKIQGVGERTVLGDSTRKVELHHMRGSQHAATMLMVYLPAEKLLIEADVYSPPALNATTVLPAPFAANLVENIDRLGLKVDRIVPIHGRVIPMSDLRAAINPSATPSLAPQQAPATNQATAVSPQASASAAPVILPQPSTNPASIVEQLPSVTTPAEISRVLRDYERAWESHDAAALAALFTEDGMTLSNGGPARRGRTAIQEGYARAGGPLSLRAVSYAMGDTVGYIIGGYSQQAGQPDVGKFVLALRRSPGGPWQIAADIDNANQPRR
jgi:glyoxylase-like metal-dependent hydrolase (beta-lactamase superfamily II)/ketosteroid isomerase-like protein